MSTFYGDMYGERRKRFGLKLGGFLGVAAVIAGGCAAAYAFSDTVKNQVKLAFSSPQDYFTWVCEKNADELSESFAGSYQEMLDLRSSGMTSHAEAQITLTEDGKNALQSQKLPDTDSLYGQVFAQQAANVLSNMDSIGFTADISEKGSGAAQNIGLTMNGKSIVSVQTASDIKDKLFYVRVPELKEQWLGIELDSFWEKTFSKAMPDIGNAEPPTAQEMQQMIREYSLLPTENITDITVTRSVPVTIAGTEVNYTEIAFPMTAGQLADSVQKIIDKAAQDERLKKICPAEDVYDKIIEEAKKAVSEMQTDAGQPVQVRLYVHEIGKICGISASGENGMNLFAAAFRKGDQFAAEARTAYDEGNEPAVLTISGTRSGDAFNGTAVMKAGSEATVTAAFTELKVVDPEKGYVSGNVALSSDQTDGEITVKLDCSNGQTAEFPIRVSGTDYGAVRLTYSVNEGAEYTVPDRSGAYFIDPTDRDFYKGYLDAASVQKFITDTAGKLGMNTGNADRAGKAAGFAAAISQFDSML